MRDAVDEKPMPFPSWASRVTEYPPGKLRTYSLRQVDLLQASSKPDILPSEPDVLLRQLACEATIYGLPAVLQYEHMFRVAIAKDKYHGFNKLKHTTDLAGPGYLGFKTPNADTLYSDAWLDLRSGPVLLAIPPMGSRYYTAHLLDAWSNAVNLSSRTLGPEGGEVWLTTVDWSESVPSDKPVLRVATPFMWLLLRVFVTDPGDLPEARSLQARVSLSGREGARGVSGDWPRIPSSENTFDVFSFLTVLDFVLRVNGHPEQETAMVYRFRQLGIGTASSVDFSSWSQQEKAAIEAGYTDAMNMIRSAVTARGEQAGEYGWRTLYSGAYGFNYLHRAATNYVGLGATVREESGAYTTFVDSDHEPLDGSNDYTIEFHKPPPVGGFWSLSAYDRETREFVENRAKRYSINSYTPGLVYQADGSIKIKLTNHIQGGSSSNTLPIPPRGFYLVIRAYLGTDEIVNGTWEPPPVKKQIT